MPTVNLSSPWTELYREFQAMFEQDKEIKIVFDEREYTLKLYVASEKKYNALNQLLYRERVFGNIKMKIIVVPPNGSKLEAEKKPLDVLYTEAFEGNPALSFARSVEALVGSFCYVVFENKVVQYFNDNIGDVYGQCSTLYQEIAKDIFDVDRFLFPAHFCTDVPKGVGKPLGEWP